MKLFSSGLTDGWTDEPWTCITMCHQPILNGSKRGAGVHFVKYLALICTSVTVITYLAPNPQLDRCIRLYYFE